MHRIMSQMNGTASFLLGDSATRLVFFVHTAMDGAARPEDSPYTAITARLTTVLPSTAIGLHKKSGWNETTRRCWKSSGFPLYNPLLPPALAASLEITHNP
jgi:hypothetical protein